eukprot:10389-Rhodomonas_salina.2
MQVSRRAPEPSAHGRLDAAIESDHHHDDAVLEARADPNAAALEGQGGAAPVEGLQGAASSPGQEEEDAEAWPIGVTRYACSLSLSTARWSHRHQAVSAHLFSHRPRPPQMC